jgi:adenine deaminase
MANFMSSDMQPTSITIDANVVDIVNRRIIASQIVIRDGRIGSVTQIGHGIDPSMPFAMPGFIDAHIHIESSMLVPSEFARMACVHGTVATVSDPHEIANVMGVEGVDFMIENGNRVPMKFCFGVPSCVPATAFETSGASIDAIAVGVLLKRPEIGYLAEMMNYPGVLMGDREVLLKLRAARDAKKPVDGHAPGLMGEQAAAYIAAGISTDHECTTLQEAEHKLRCGMKILIREGSAAKNFSALSPLIDSHPNDVMFCSDDKHPDELAEGHINLLVQRAIAAGADLFHVLRAACINPIEHYQLPVGQLRIGDAADFILVEDLERFRVKQVFIDGHCVAQQGTTSIAPTAIRAINHFCCEAKQPSDFRVKSVTGESRVHVRVIQAIDGKLITSEREVSLPVDDGFVLSNPGDDTLKIAVVNRYRPAAPAVAFISGFGLKRGAIASSVGHDSHNILAVGVDDESLCAAVNCVIAGRGGIAAVDGYTRHSMPLPVAGIMSDQDGPTVAREYRRIDQFTKQTLGSRLTAPFMTLSFMGLLVIPKLKLSDLGLFDGESFAFVPNSGQSNHPAGSRDSSQ